MLPLAALADPEPLGMQASPRDLPAYAITPASWLIGTATSLVPRQGETFLEIGEQFDLGYNEVIAANRNSDPWIPKREEPLVIPSRWLVPDAPRDGLVLNIPEMRLYYFRDHGSRVITVPVGLGREDWKTPQGSFRVRGKTVNPTWVIPETIRKERIQENGFSEHSIPGGSPDNPLGKYRLELTLPTYGLHGSNKEWGVGMLVSHGCLRLYNEDIATLFPMIEVGTAGAFVYQPVKVGKHNGRVLVEVHDDIYGFEPALYKTAMQLIAKRGWSAEVDPELLEATIEARTGVPTDVGWVAGPTATAN
ncbi:MAG TPA: L,D-transpeptidase family protein [Candidatus Limnocylindrales bacterium]|nr:L,D-transpeptidase family protein [Candidatus Limnocylindrales bacterium]